MWRAISRGGRWWSWSMRAAGCGPITMCVGTGLGLWSRRVVGGFRAWCVGITVGPTGSMVDSAPARDFGATDGFEPAEISLTGALVEGWRGLVFVNLDLDRRAPPLLEALGTFAEECEPYPIEELVVTHEAQHDLACNWKTYADNYLEGYHIPLVHPALSKDIDVKRYVVDVDERHRWVRHSAPARDGAVSGGCWLWRWPNLALNLYPDAMNVERYDPVTPYRTRLRYSYSFRRPGDHEANEAVIRTSAQVTAEDIAICESVQRNLESGSYDTGWLSPKHERGVAAFQRWVRETVDD